MKCWITGAGGFIGRYLVRHLVGQGHEVIATDVKVLERSEFSEADRVRWIVLDLLKDDLARLCAEWNPDAVFHLAAQSLPTRSWDEPKVTFDVNIQGTVRLLEAVRAEAPTARTVVVTSSAIYAPRSHSEPITEAAPLDPVTPYGISKLAQDHIARLYAEYYGMRVVRARPFYLVGAGKVGDVCSDLARGIVAIERGEAWDLAVGNLDVVRDFLDVRDGVAALVLLAERGCAGEAYNISSGQGRRIGEVLDTMTRAAGLSVRVRVDPRRIRPLDEPVKIADNSKLRALGWTSRIPIETTLRDILDYWRRHATA